jgi:hypothetical protein
MDICNQIGFLWFDSMKMYNLMYNKMLRGLIVLWVPFNFRGVKSSLLELPLKIFAQYREWPSCAQLELQYMS